MKRSIDCVIFVLFICDQEESITWEEKLIVLGIINLLNFQSHEPSLVIHRSTELFQRVIKLSIEKEDNPLVHYELFTFLQKCHFYSDETTDYSPYQPMINQGCKRIINGKQPLQPHSLFALCSYYKEIKVVDRDFINQLFEKSINSNHQYVIKEASSLFQQHSNIIDSRLGSTVIKIMDDPSHEQEMVDLVIKYFERLESITERRKYLQIVVSKLLYTKGFSTDMVDQFVYTKLIGWVFDGSIGMDPVIYFPPMFKIILSRHFDTQDEAQLVRLCEKYPDKVAHYVNTLFDEAVRLYLINDNNEGSDLLFSLFSIYYQFHASKDDDDDDEEDPIFDIYYLYPQNQEISNLNSEFPVNGSDQPPTPPQFATLQDYSELIHQITTLFDDSDSYDTGIAIFHIEKLLDSIKKQENNKVFRSILISKLVHFHQILKNLSCDSTTKQVDKMGNEMVGIKTFVLWVEHVHHTLFHGIPKDLLCVKQEDVIDQNCLGTIRVVNYSLASVQYIS
ncbi:hypothetical protein DFA_10095 [Cavenderia fasciculata]|uniref:Uncharacterized protein n=1 Tax=Cavenderia fasciculata TaxID=261658 RepID=F4Q992_CACFS|nr:uncharacterized protein DFA_10095 [Cavenderia fasciculata]EGG15261.1 hypothetical protein DFA_10095 [Cavenderia fasciculata]|eukprot:XP_004351981.1 hypothetical protein DFA_10095 [Cavenderia fasciculata]